MHMYVCVETNLAGNAAICICLECMECVYEYEATVKLLESEFFVTKNSYVYISI